MIVVLMANAQPHSGPALSLALSGITSPNVHSNPVRITVGDLFSDEETKALAFLGLSWTEPSQYSLRLCQG